MKYLWFVLFVFFGGFCALFCLGLCGESRAPLVAIFAVVVMVVLLVQIRIANAEFKADLITAMTQVEPMFMNYNMCVDDIDKVTSSALTTILAAEKARNAASIFNVIVIC